MAGNDCRRTASRLDAARVVHEPLPDERTSAGDPDLAALRLQVHNALQVLEETRQIVVLHYLSGLSYQEIGHAFGLSVQTSTGGCSGLAASSPGSSAHAIIRDQVMNSSLHDETWEDRLRTGLGNCPPPDFEPRTRNADALSMPVPSLSRRSIPHWRILMQRSAWIAASLLLVLGLFCLYSGGSLGPGAFAQTIPGVDTPNHHLDHHLLLACHKRRRQADLAPGGAPPPRLPAPRAISGDLSGQGRPAERIEITDAQTGRTLVLDQSGRKPF